MTDEILDDISLEADSVETAIPEELLPEPAQPEQVMVADIRFRSNSKVYFFDPGDLELQTGDHVIIDTARGQEFGYCTGGNHLVPFRDIVPPLRKVLRLATEKDERVNAES